MALQQSPIEFWNQVEAIFLEAIELPVERQEEFLLRACAGDESLRQEVVAMLAADRRAGEFLSGAIMESGSGWLRPAGATGPRPEQIDAYRILREIGRGGMGTVYLAERADGEFHKQVAIKLATPGSASQEILRRFYEERRILASLDHPGIARLLDGGTTEDGVPFFVMEHVAGIPIDRYCRERQLGIPARLRLFREVCAAAHYAHQNLIVHRDLKPGNILVTESGAPKLLDFGIAKLLRPGASELTTGLRALTPAYASPEQMAGRAVTTASDIYSLGVILYELLADARPYELADRSPAEIIQAICEREPPAPSRQRQRIVGERLDRDLDDIVLMALSKDPTRRYGSASELADDLDRYLTGMPVRARRSTAGYRAEKFVRRHKTPVAIAGLLAVTLLSGIFATAHEAKRARAALAEAQQARAHAEAQRLRAEEARGQAQAQQARAEREWLRAEGALLTARQQRARAAGEQARAERHFNRSRKFAGALVFEIHDLIKDLPGATRARERLISLAMEHYDGLARETGHSSSMLREIADAYTRLGDVQGNSAHGELGNRPAAIENYRKALAIHLRLARQATGEPEAQGRLLKSYRNLGTALESARRKEEALEIYQQGAQIAEELHASGNRTGGALQQLEFFHRRLNALLQLLGDLSESVRHEQRARELRNLLASQAAPANADAADGGEESVRYQRASLLRDAGNIEAALRLFRELAIAAEREAAQRPDSALLRRTAANRLHDVGKMYEDKGEHGNGLTYYRRTLALAEAMIAADADDMRNVHAVRDSCRDVAKMLSKLGDQQESLTYYRRALAMDERLLANAPISDEVASELIRSHMLVAQRLASLNDLAAGESHFLQARTLCEQMMARTPSSPSPRLSLAGIHNQWGDSLRSRGRLEQAIAQYRQALQLAEGSMRESRAGLQARRKADEALYRLGECLLKSGDLPGAENAFRRMIQFREEAARASRENVMLQTELAYGYTKFGELFAARAAGEQAPADEQRRHWNEARAWYQRSLEIFHNLQGNEALKGRYAHMPGNISREIDACTAAIHKLQRESADRENQERRE
ncbi:MAG: protein kinase [Blastocatellia bacterium]|nr:protein kinase [Blastocatellia bacterium]